MQWPYVFLYMLLVGALLSPAPLAAQWNQDRAILIGLDYGPFATAGNLADRFGSGFALGGGVDYLLTRRNWQLGVMAQYGFGNEVKEDVLAALRTEAGFVIGNQRQPARVELRQRQLFVGPRVGYTFPLGENPRAGLKTSTAAGYFFSRIRIQDDPVQYVPQLDPAYQAAYDRLTGGPALHQFLGYQQLGGNRRLNFYLGADLTLAFTRPLRIYDAATFAAPEDGGRTDVVLGLRGGIILPIYRGEGREIYY
ncbi:hypothetical protein GGR26_003502 [Lewinella marina]|uniref:Outer membrane protein beta-barrel domain-containing protein n=1 Tax=Neolewinella marina TaxID=438751 RepID=A0A2G0CCB6_9BACT|nr:hypothetical protein [Neolewinella marina]NJB87718.1 hypothetical protein [Neolewinella marina]PHK97605.1 hypothetical protein CGL56_14300 [Neolewinella marina]